MRWLNAIILFLGCSPCFVFCNGGCRRPNGIPCCYNEYMDQSSKQCKACKPGLIGWKCEEPCKKGYYGLLCRYPCLCSPNDCDPEVGCPRAEFTTSSFSIQYNWRMSQGFDNTVKYSASTRSTKINKKRTMEFKSTMGFAGTRTQKLTEDYWKSSTTHTKILEYSEEKTTTMQWHTGSQRSESDEAEFKEISIKQNTTPNAKDTDPDVIRQSDTRETLQHMSQYMELISVSLFLIVAGVFILILLLVYHTWKSSRRVEHFKEMKQFNSGPMYCRQLRGTLERGYMSLSNRERLARSGRQSDYVMPSSLNIEAVTTV